MLYNSTWQGRIATGTHIHIHRAPAAKLASRTVKLATGEQSTRPPLGKGKGKKVVEARGRNREAEMEMEREVKKEDDREGEDERHNWELYVSCRK